MLRLVVLSLLLCMSAGAVSTRHRVPRSRLRKTRSAVQFRAGRQGASTLPAFFYLQDRPGTTPNRREAARAGVYRPLGRFATNSRKRA